MAIPLHFEDVTRDHLKTINKLYLKKPPQNQYVDTESKAIAFYKVDEPRQRVWVPLGGWKVFFDEFPNTEAFGCNYRKIEYLKFKKELYTIDTDPKNTRDQDVVYKKAMSKLKRDHCVFIAAFPGFGKTTLGNAIFCHFRMPVMVLCYSKEVCKQWGEEFKKFSTARKIQFIKGNDPIDRYADVYICGVIKGAKLDRDRFRHVGLVILDEAHVCTITAFEHALLNLQPKYIIGLSATPKRSDGMHTIFDAYFGDRKEFIVRHEVKEYTVYKYNTGIQPTIKMKWFKGRQAKDWTTLINSLAYNEARHDLIVDLVMKHPERHILVLSNRKIQSESLYNKLLKKGIKKGEVVLFIGNTSLKEKTYRILIAEQKKASIGFDDPRLDMLILTYDVTNIEQVDGRCRTVNNIVYDLVDSDNSLEKHWETREKWYHKRGATIEVIGKTPYVTIDKKSTLLPKKRLLGPIKKN